MNEQSIQQLVEFVRAYDSAKNELVTDMELNNVSLLNLCFLSQDAFRSLLISQYFFRIVQQDILSEYEKIFKTAPKSILEDNSNGSKLNIIILYIRSIYKTISQIDMKCLFESSSISEELKKLKENFQDIEADYSEVSFPVLLDDILKLIIVKKSDVNSLPLKLQYKTYLYKLCICSFYELYHSLQKDNESDTMLQKALSSKFNLNLIIINSIFS